jgi:hypothetical protein
MDRRRHLPFPPVPFWESERRQAGEAPFFGRVVALLSQRAFERDENWIKGLEDLEKADARSGVGHG